MMPRQVEPEWLDELPASDSRAQRSRADLTRLNALMAHARFASNALLRNGFAESGKRIIDVGSGDGRLVLKIARRMHAPGRDAILIDRLQLISQATVNEFRSIGWGATIVEDDVFAGLQRVPAEPGNVITANLFLHHFADEPLRRLLGLIANASDVFVACEPRRSAGALLASRLVGVIGCNSVTRHDAVASVRAGFRDQELSALWPTAGGWSLEERSYGLFSHCFIARKVTP